MLIILFSIFIPGKYPSFHKARTETRPEKIREFAYLKTPYVKYYPLSVVTG